MKHIEINVKLNTMLEEDYINIENLKNDNKSYDEAIKRAYEYSDKVAGEMNKNKNVRIISNMTIEEGDARRENVRKYGGVIKFLNEKLVSECNENLSCVAIKMEGRNISFIIRTTNKEPEKDIEKIKNKIISIINENIKNIIFENEFLTSINITEKEISVKEFYFYRMADAEDFGLNARDFMYKLKEYKYGSDFEAYHRKVCDDFLFTDDIDKKLCKKEFYDKYNDLLYNKDFGNEIERIYNSKNEYNVNINPVHYEIMEEDEDTRIKYYNALGVALYSNNRIKNKKITRIKIALGGNYVCNDTVELLLKNCKSGLVIIEFTVYRNMSVFSDRDYWGRTSLREKQLTDCINELKDEVQFVFYFDKYQDNVREQLRDDFEQLNLVRFNDKIMPERALSFIEELANNENIEVTDRLINEVMLQKNDMTIKDAKSIFEDYKDYIISHKYFPEYKEYYDGIGGVDNYVDPYEMLMALPGLKNVKETITDILTYHDIYKYRKEQFLEYKNKIGVDTRYNGNTIPMHMVFMGNPGTCKTTVAKLIAKIFKSRGITKTDRTEFYGVEGRCHNLENAFKYAYGGILFIDEAYNFAGVTNLVALMEEHRKDVIVILAGYSDAMRAFMKRNEGLNSRIKYKIEFEDYTEDELWEILKYQAKENNMTMENDVKEKVWSIFSSNQCDKELGNGRLVRNILDMAMMKQAKRLKNLDFKNKKYDLSKLNTLTSDDFDIDYKKITGNIVPKIIGNKDPEIELNNMIGIENVKKMIDKIVASSKVKKVRREVCDGVDTGKSLIASPMHLAFLGNPGSAKTTVARLFARILKKKGIIKKDTIVEVGRSDLVGKYVGWTAPTVEEKFNKAKGGILFIDEAYSLIDDKEGSYGDEAINTIIQQMENKRDEVIVIFAGYTDRMRKFIERNEGLRSRLSYILEFDDYNEEELYGIFEKFLNDDKLAATEDAKNKVKEIISNITKNKDFGNGRFIRKMIENAKLNMDYRLSMKNEEYTYDELMTLEAKDFDNLESDEVLDEKSKCVMGFAA